MYALDTSNISSNQFIQTSVNFSNFEYTKEGSALVINDKYIVNMGGFKNNRTYHIDIKSSNINIHTNINSSNNNNFNDLQMIEESSIPVHSLYYGTSVYVPSLKRIYYLGGIKGFIPQTAVDTIYYAQFDDIQNDTTSNPSATPTEYPISQPSSLPSYDPTRAPSTIPSKIPSKLPSQLPSQLPSELPSTSPSISRTEMPSMSPPMAPSEASSAGLS